jgi:hypothetical protein
MKTISLVLSLCVIVLASCGSNESDNPEQKWQAAKYSAGVTINITDALQNWRKDSLGCEDKRIAAMNEGLFKVVKLDSLSFEDVVQLLGKPNRTRHNLVLVVGKEEDVIVHTYYTGSDCYEENGQRVTEPVSWLDVSILPRTNRVVHVMGAIR